MRGAAGERTVLVMAAAWTPPDVPPPPPAPRPGPVTAAPMPRPPAAAAVPAWLAGAPTPPVPGQRALRFRLPRLARAVPLLLVALWAAQAAQFRSWPAAAAAAVWLALCVWQARFGVHADAEQLTLIGLRRQTFPWTQVVGVYAEQRGGAPMVRVQLASGRRLWLRAPIGTLTGWCGSNRRFARDYWALVGWWLAYREPRSSR